MKLIRTLLILILIVAFSISAAARQPQDSPQNGSPNPSSGAPVLVIDSLTHDFGEVKPGTTLRYAFKVKNQGKSELQIQNVAPS